MHEAVDVVCGTGNSLDMKGLTAGSDVKVLSELSGERKQRGGLLVEWNVPEGVLWHTAKLPSVPG